MAYQSDKIIVFSCAPRELEQCLSDQMGELGYPQPEFIHNHLYLLHLLEQQAVAAIVLLLGDEPGLHDDLDAVLPSMHGLPVLGLFSQHCPMFTQPVVKTCHEFETYPCNEQQLDFRLSRILHREREFAGLEDELLIRMQIVGNSEKFQQVLDKIYKITQSDAPVFIDGETGTGKELAARAIHYLGSRRDQPFIAANCGAIPDQLIENELFGHEKGAFTDAKDNRQGLVAQAEGGSLFLDEIETLSHKGQVVLLRFLENMSYRPLGAGSAKTADLRVIVATNESIAERVAEGSFRKDLFYRINIMNIVMPPLRERSQDIGLLAQHFVSRFQEKYDQPQKQLHPDSLDALKYYDWPGNVRELENLLHREFLMADGNLIYLDEIEAMSRERRASGGDRRHHNLMKMKMINAKDQLVSDFEKEYLESVLQRSKGNVSEAARLAGKERRSFTRLLEKYFIDSREFKPR